MKYGMFRYLRLGAASMLAGMFAFVWWCVLYPELCFPQDTYEVVYEAEEIGAIEDADKVESTKADGAKAAETDSSGKENCYELLQADGEQIIIKSRLLEWLEQHIN